MRGLALALATSLLLAGLLAPPAPAAEEPDKHALDSVEATLSTTQAGAHPDFTTSFEVTTDAEGGLFAKTRDVIVDLPPGLLANPGVIAQCTTLQLGTDPANSHCPQDSQVGVAQLAGGLTFPLYNMTAPSDTLARLGFIGAIYPYFINAEVRPDLGVRASVETVSSAAGGLRGATTTLWGVPADPSHDELRITPLEAIEFKAPPGGGRASNLPAAPFMTNPTRCGVPLEVEFAVNSYQLPEQFSTMSAPIGPFTGCGKLAFEPSLQLAPTTRRAASPAGVNAELEVPQDQTPQGLTTSHIRNAVVSLPEGVTIAPGAANGLEACSAEQVGFEQPGPSNCPPASKIGTVEIISPPLARPLGVPRPLHGAIYQRSPEPGRLLGIWLTADELGAYVKLKGEIEADPVTGQLTSRFTDNPEVPVETLKLHFFGGPHGPLATPSTCGTYQTEWEFTPWSGNPSVDGTSPLRIDEGCDTGGFSPVLSAGTRSPEAGEHSDFILDLSRKDGEQNVSGLDVTLPPGLLAKLKGVSRCEGAALQSGNCPDSSKVGSVSAAVGPGPSPLWVPQPGKDPTAVYLAGPYKGAPLSVLVKTPAQAGPFDLGTVLTRAAIELDPKTAQATVTSDPLPQILEGVPVTYQRIHVDMDRPEFILNPTDCSPIAIEAKVTSDKGQVASPSSAFQVSGCRGLGFKPRLAMRLIGGTKRGGHPKLRTVLRPRPGDANFEQITALLPRSAFLDQAHIRTICTRVQFASESCPQGAVYGHATAHTPLLDEPLTGPVYLRSSDNFLPDLVFDLKGLVDVELSGRIDSVRGGIRASFASIPDAPVSKFVLTMQGGKKGLIVNSRDLCAKPSRATIELEAQNGRQRTLRPQMRADCGDKRTQRGRWR